MKILQIHNRYRLSGGEDRVADGEAELLSAKGHQVVRFLRENRDIAEHTCWDKLRLGIDTIWARDCARELDDVLQRERPDIAHVHNTLPRISPAAYYCCRRAGVPVVQTLHNFRLMCPSGLLSRDGRDCTECVGLPVAWPALRHACYRRSRAVTASVAIMLAVHTALRTWTRMVDVYIAVSEFERRVMLEHGLPEDKLVLVRNFVSEEAKPASTRGSDFVFAGRLSPEKGVETLLRAWRQLRPAPRLLVVGDGPLRKKLEREAAALPAGTVCFTGWLSRESTLERIQNAYAVIVPSECFETAAISAAEAFACGVPVIASHTGTLAEVVTNGYTGRHFCRADAEDLARIVRWASANPDAIAQMGRQARLSYEARYGAEGHYHALMEIYRRAIAARAPRALSILGACPTVREISGNHAGAALEASNLER